MVQRLFSRSSSENGTLTGRPHHHRPPYFNPGGGGADRSVRDRSQMDSNEEEMVLRMSIGAATTVIVMIKAWINRRRKRRRMMLSREPYETRKSHRNVHMTRILDGSSISCVEYLRMRKTPFLKLAKLIRELGLLNDTIHVSVEEQLALFLHIVGHKANNRVMRVEFVRSGETVSRYFNRVLKAAFALCSRFMKQATGNMSPEIINNPLWYPYFEGCIGMIDCCHVDAYLPLSLQPRFKSPKGVTQNILAACTPDKLFTYILAGSEGATDDNTVLKHALSKPPPHGLCLLKGKYYLCDADYTTGHGFIAPYHGVRYHLKEHSGCTPNTRFELFNLRHSSLRAKIEDCIRILKNRFKILTSKPNYPFPTQVDIVLACGILHNYIAMVDPDDEIFNEEVETLGEEVAGEDGPGTVEFAPKQTQDEFATNGQQWMERRDQIAWDMWVDYCNNYRGGNTTESAT